MADQMLIKDKEIVVPGDKIASGMGFLPGKGTFRKNSDILAEKLGVLNVDGNVMKIVSLSGVYNPKVNDRVIARVIDVLMTGWRFDLNCPYSAVLSMKDATSEFIPRGADLTKYFVVGDMVVCKITNVTSQKLVDVTMSGPGLRKLRGGRFIHVNTNKVPRIIGKEGSMVSMIKNATNCNIVIGQNGVVWIDGEPDKEVITVEAIKMVESKSHTAGLTDKVADFLEKETGVKTAKVSKK